MPEIDREKVAARLREREREIEERKQKIKDADEGMLSNELADYDQHEADEGTETFEQELDTTTILILDAELKDVRLAMQRLEEGKYGICIVGGEEIPAKRLEALPEAVRCIEHQNRYEAELRAQGPPPMKRF